MEPIRMLVVHYSRTGTTRAVGEAIADALACPAEGLRDVRDRAGIMGYLRSIGDSRNRAAPPLRPYVHDPRDYDLIVLGTPVWVGRMAAPLRTYVEMNARVLPEIALFCTYGGRGDEATLDELEALCGKAAVARLSVRARERRIASKIAAFAREIEESIVRVPRVADDASPPPEPVHLGAS